MNDETKPITPYEPKPVTRTRGPARYEPEIYIEDTLERVANKYLAVNIAARRARQLNELELPVGIKARSAKKPTTQALLELIEGNLKYELVDLTPPEVAVDDDVDETDEDVAALFEELEDSDTDADFDFEDFDDSDS